MNIIYQHTQKGIVTLIILGGMVLSTFIMVKVVNPIQGHEVRVVYFLVGIFLLIALMMYQLAVTVTDTEIRVKFGIAPAFPVFRLEDIADAQAVRNPWWVGWGIRYGLNYWVYNVSGFGAVELVKKDGSRVRIGTDEPEILAQKIREQLNK